METAYFAAGCFWGVEHRFKQTEGVLATEVGYMNGTTENPTYKQVCAGDTGHAEAVKINFDPGKISYAELCQMFYNLHNPTTLNRQGPDVGSQYRSGMYYTNDEQRETAQAVKTEMSSQFDMPIVTEVAPAQQFYKAEEYHQDYLEKNGRTCGI